METKAGGVQKDHQAGLLVRSGAGMAGAEGTGAGTDHIMCK
jgi:hypothetical protein